MRLSIFILSLFSCTVLSAHNFNEVTYIIEKPAENWQLSIHFTPKTAIDLLEYLHPELKEENVLRLADYYADFTAYFNETIQLSLDDQTVELQLRQAQLNLHDAAMNFELLGAPDVFKDYTIKVNSFLKIFQNPINVVKVITKNNTKTCHLNKQTRICSTQIQSAAIPLKDPMLMTGLLLFIIGGGSMFFLAQHN